MHYLIKITICLILSAVMAGCTSDGKLKLYHIDIPQGNIVTDEMVAQLQPGMTYNQVRFVLGTPLLVDTFHQTRWDYVYSYKPGFPSRPPYDEPQEKRLKIYFTGGVLQSFEMEELLETEVIGDEVVDESPDATIAKELGQVKDEGVTVDWEDDVRRERILRETIEAEENAVVVE